MTTDFDCTFKKVKRLLEEIPWTPEANLDEWKRLWWRCLNSDIPEMAHTAVRELFDRARRGEVWARELAMGTAEGYIADNKPMPEVLAAYVRDEREGKLPRIKRGPRQESLAARNAFLYMAVWCAMLDGFSRTRRDKRHPDKPMSACLLVTKAVRDLFGREIEEFVLEQLTNDLRRKLGPV